MLIYLSGFFEISKEHNLFEIFSNIINAFTFTSQSHNYFSKSQFN